ncbi:MAG: T9SS type A sorting domain-containing protein [Flavobacteriales bacterium]|nr:T9SS type A sorting domain-containing protein [Flavobacteriales bacterium]
MKTKISFLFWMLSALSSFAQCPNITDVLITDTGSGSYHLDVVVENPMGMTSTGTWFYYPFSGTGGMGGYAYFPSPGVYQVIITAYFDDPNTAQADDCVVSFSYDASIICEAVDIDYPVVTIDEQNDQFIVVTSVSGGSQPYTYNWQTDAPYLLNGDGSIIVPFTDAGYLNGSVSVIDANGCFAWAHEFGGINPNAECELNVDIVESAGTVQVNMDYNLGTSDVYYPMYTIDYGDGTTESFFNQTSFTHTYITPGEYLICVDATNELGNCSDNYCENVQVSLTSGINDMSSLNWNVYPNPSSGEFKIQAELGAEVTVFEASGRMVYTTTMRENDQLQLNFPAGCYVIKLKDGTRSEVKSLIIR